VAVECGVSDKEGEYTIAGLPPGEWLVGFDAGRGYQVEYFDGATELGRATPVRVSPGAAIRGVDATMHTPPPRPLPPPPRGGPPPSTTGSSTPATLFSAPAGNATGGSAVLGSTSVHVAPAVALASSRISVAGHGATTRILCRAAACHGSLELTIKIVLAHRSHHRIVRRSETIVLGRGSFSLAAGARAVVRLSLTRAGIARLVHPKTHSPATMLTIVVSGGRTVTTAVSTH
jgi:hypothetical protein